MKKVHQKRERIVRKKGWAKIGIFLLGTLFGLILTLGSLVGVGFWAYKNLNLKKVEKITNQTIDVGNNTSIKNITIEDIVDNISAISKDKNYTIAKMEKDFGITIVGNDGLIPASMYGLDLTSLKDSTLKTLDNDLEDIINNANINTFLSLTNQTDDKLGMFADIINTNIDYYYNSADNKLYEDLSGSSYSNPVSFDYTISADNSKVILDSDKDTNYPIQSGKVTISFRKLAIESAFSSFDKVTDNLKISTILDLHKTDNVWYDSSNQKVSGIISALADKTVNDLTNKETFDNLTLIQVLDLDGTETGVIKAIREKKISELDDEDTYTKLKLGDVLTIDENSDPILKSLKDTQIDQFSTKIETLKLNEVIKIDSTSDHILQNLADSPINDLSNAVNDMTLSEVLNLDGTETGVLKALSGIQIKSLDDKIKDLKTYEVLGYYQQTGDSNYYKDEGCTIQVKGIMAQLAGCNINSLSESLIGDTGILKTLTIGDLVDDNIISDPNITTQERAMTISELYDLYKEYKNRLS